MCRAIPTLVGCITVDAENEATLRQRSRRFFAVLTLLASSRAVGGSSEPGIGIRREGDRLFAQATGWGRIALFMVLFAGRR